MKRNSSSTPDAQLFLPPQEVGKTEPADAVFRKSEQPIDALSESEQLAVSLLNTAFDNAHLTNKEIAHLCGVSTSLVEKWRSTEARGGPSFVQMLMLPPSFHLELTRATNKHFGFGRQFVARLLNDVCDLALAVDR